MSKKKARKSASNASGQPKKILDIPTIIEDMRVELLCPICSCILNDVYSLPCQHHFCHECIQELIDNGASDLNCVECSMPFWAKDARRNTSLINVVNAYKELWKIVREELELAGVAEEDIGLGNLDEGRRMQGGLEDENSIGGANAHRRGKQLHKISAFKIASKLNTGLRRGAATAEESCSSSEEESDTVSESDLDTDTDTNSNTVSDAEAPDERQNCEGGDRSLNQDLLDEGRHMSDGGDEEKDKGENRDSDETFGQDDPPLNTQNRSMGQRSLASQMSFQKQDTSKRVKPIESDKYTDLVSPTIGSQLQASVQESELFSLAQRHLSSTEFDHTNAASYENIQSAQPHNQLTDVNSIRSLDFIQTIPLSENQHNTQDLSTDNDTAPKNIGLAVGPKFDSADLDSRVNLYPYSSKIKHLVEGSPKSLRRSTRLSPQGEKSRQQIRPTQNEKASSSDSVMQRIIDSSPSILPYLELRHDDSSDLSEADHFATPKELSQVDTNQNDEVKMEVKELPSHVSKIKLSEITLSITGVPAADRSRILIITDSLRIAVAKAPSRGVTHTIVSTAPSSREGTVTAIFGPQVTKKSPTRLSKSNSFLSQANLLFARRTLSYLTALLEGCSIVSEAWFFHFVSEIGRPSQPKSIAGEEISSGVFFSELSEFESAQHGFPIFIKGFFPCYEASGDVSYGPSLAPRLFRDFNLRCKWDIKLWPKLVYEYQNLTQKVLATLQNLERQGETKQEIQHEFLKQLSLISGSSLPLPFIPPDSWFDDVCPPSHLLSPFAIALVGPFKETDPKEEELRRLINLSGARFVELAPFVSTFQQKAELFGKFGLTEANILSACQTPFCQFSNDMKAHIPSAELSPSLVEEQLNQWLLSRRSGDANEVGPDLTLHQHQLQPIRSLKLIHNMLTTAGGRCVSQTMGSSSRSLDREKLSSESMSFDFPLVLKSSSRPFSLATQSDSHIDKRINPNLHEWWGNEAAIDLWIKCTLTIPIEKQLPVVVVANHLIASDSPKLKPFLRNRIPVVAAGWLMDCIGSGKRLSFDPYTLKSIRAKLS